jgi:uncharacterized protein (DUF1778 family)
VKEVLMGTSAHRKQPADRELKKDSRGLDEYEHMALIGADLEVFLDAVRNPPEPTEKLVTALRRHRIALG